MSNRSTASAARNRNRPTAIGRLLLAAALAAAPLRMAPAAGAGAAPNYAEARAWAALPGVASRALDVPAGIERSAPGSAAVFFVHPTTYLSPMIGNADFDAGGEVGARVDRLVLRYQASVFNGCCAIYAPRYRQASLRAITSDTPPALAATDLAYGDVARAFDRFLQLLGDRPFILAGHSQGSIHALRLLEQRIAGSPLAQRLIAAYLIGVALPDNPAKLGLPICDAPTATGCVVSWNSVRRGHVDERRLHDSIIWWQDRYQPIAGRPIVCVDPLSWRIGGSSEPTANLGAVYRGPDDAPIPAPIEGLTGAWCEGGLLGVSIPAAERRRFGDLLTLTGVYHDFDYGLFYVNLRVNAAARVAAWQARAAKRDASARLAPERLLEHTIE